MMILFDCPVERLEEIYKINPELEQHVQKVTSLPVWAKDALRSQSSQGSSSGYNSNRGRNNYGGSGYSNSRRGGSNGGFG